ncbi:unnamed protein product [Sphagnum balticum]
MAAGSVSLDILSLSLDSAFNYLSIVQLPTPKTQIASNAIKVTKQILRVHAFRFHSLQPHQPQLIPNNLNSLSLSNLNPNNLINPNRGRRRNHQTFRTAKGITY